LSHLALTTHSISRNSEIDSFVSFFGTLLFSGMNNSPLISSPFLISLSEARRLPLPHHPSPQQGKMGVMKLSVIHAWEGLIADRRYRAFI